jgi:hypothetical protein
MERQWHDRSPVVNQSLFNPEWIYGVCANEPCAIELPLTSIDDGTNHTSRKQTAHMAHIQCPSLRCKRNPRPIFSNPTNPSADLPRRPRLLLWRLGRPITRRQGRHPKLSRIHVDWRVRLVQYTRNGTKDGRQNTWGYAQKHAGSRSFPSYGKSGQVCAASH